MANYELNIAHLYGNLMNTYGDNGNLLMLKYIAEKWGFLAIRRSLVYMNLLMLINMTWFSLAVVKTLSN